MHFHRTVRDRAATVWRWCSVAFDIVVDRWHCRPDVEGWGPLIRSVSKKKCLAYKFVKGTVQTC